jgi:CrcB protein
MSFLLVGLGSIAGSLFRFALGYAFPNSDDGTLAANLIGVSIASFLLVLMERRGITQLRWLLLPGFCGGLTTFSGVTVLAFEGQGNGLIYISMTAILSLIAVVTTVPLAQKVIPVRQ